MTIDTALQEKAYAKAYAEVFQEGMESGAPPYLWQATSNDVLEDETVPDGVWRMGAVFAALGHRADYIEGVEGNYRVRLTFLFGLDLKPSAVMAMFLGVSVQTADRWFDKGVKLGLWTPFKNRARGQRTNWKYDGVDLGSRLTTFEKGWTSPYPSDPDRVEILVGGFTRLPKVWIYDWTITAQHLRAAALVIHWGRMGTCSRRTLKDDFGRVLGVGHRRARDIMYELEEKKMIWSLQQENRSETNNYGGSPLGFRYAEPFAEYGWCKNPGVPDLKTYDEVDWKVPAYLRMDHGEGSEGKEAKARYLIPGIRSLASEADSAPVIHAQ